MTHICVSKLTIIGSDNGLSPDRRQAIISKCGIIVNWTFRNKLQWNFNRNSSIFIQENAFESVVCETVSMCWANRPETSSTRMLLLSWQASHAKSPGVNTDTMAQRKNNATPIMWLVEQYDASLLGITRLLRGYQRPSAQMWKSLTVNVIFHAYILHDFGPWISHYIPYICEGVTIYPCH